MVTQPVVASLDLRAAQHRPLSQVFSGYWDLTK